MQKLSLKNFIKPVRPRSDCEEGAERRATWMELFYDLVFVVAISVVSQMLYQNTTWLGLAQCSILFVAVWNAWLAGTFYADRFDNDDLYHHFFYFAQMLCIVFVALFIPNGFDTKSQSLAMAYSALWLLIFTLYLRVIIALPSSRVVTGKVLCGITLSIVVWIISIFIPPPGRFVCWVLGLILYLSTPVVLRKTLTRSQATLSDTHLPERFALFTIIVLGETIASTVHGIQLHALTPFAIVTAISGLVLAFVIWQLYFQDISIELHAGKFTVTLQWELAHLPWSRVLWGLVSPYATLLLMTFISLHR